ncbi:outer membrane protein assembly factor BamB family protein [Stieleria tagensis]|uniref:outer membrane protein assembly factor BamB family protein n=1 Tax=Stieleria tagensis TaxID=2956795 RepID=UPI00209A9D53|nr:PQQ-binding-like beta-propeller repeat protein [Stieleria tagensis]
MIHFPTTGLRTSGAPSALFQSVWIAAGFILCSLVADQSWGADWLYPRGDAAASGATASQLPAELKVAWEYKADEAIETTPVVSRDQVYTADVMGTVYALSRQDGTLVWKKSFDTGFLAAPIVADQQLIIGDIEGNVYALAIADGTQRWTQTTAGEISGAAALYKDNVLVASQDGKLYCFAAADGKPQWTYEADDQIRCSPTVAGQLTFLGGCDAKLHVVDLETGKAVGEPLPLAGPTGSTPAIQGDFAVVPVMDGSVFGFDWKANQQRWRYEDMEQSQEYRSSAAIAGNVAVVSSQRKHVDAIDLTTGKRIWRHTLKRRADASPVIAGDDVWVPATDGRLLRLSLADGTERWVFEIRGGFAAGVAVTDTELFVADDNGIVRCFR